jgi:4-hydroxy-3-methylbut-2-enyl diphosphate reductase
VDDANRVIAALRQKYPQISNPPKDDICYATQNRQDAVHVIAQKVDLVLVLGSQNSSNSKRLAEIALSLGPHAQLIDGVEEIDPVWMTGVQSVLVTAGASAPEDVVQEVLEYLRTRHDAEIIEETVREENVHFPLPKSLRELVPLEALAKP